MVCLAILVLHGYKLDCASYRYLHQVDNEVLSQLDVSCDWAFFCKKKTSAGSLNLPLVNLSEIVICICVISMWSIINDVGTACKEFQSVLVAKNNNTSLFIIISHCVTVSVYLNQISAFRVRRAATWPLNNSRAW